jgi:putative heme transporter
VGSHIGLPAELGVPLVRNAVRALQMYFIGTSIVAVFNGVVIGLGAVVLGTPLAVVLGLVNFFASYIPYIGAVVGGAVAVLLAIAGGGISDGLWMLLIVILANSVFQTVVQQLALGATLKLHPFGVLLATTIGGVLGGAIASAMAAPLVAISLDAVRQIRAAGIFAGDPQGEDGLQTGEASGPPLPDVLATR